jgi:hypothetical protein
MSWRITCRAQRNKSFDERFWEKVDKSGSCWLWTGCKDKDGYGFFRDKGKNLKAHRVSLAMRLMRPLRGLALHSCDNPSCVNPDHLREGNNSMNQIDAVNRGRRTSQKLTADDVTRIREAHLFGASARDLSQAYGVDSASIYSIVNREKWRHVP